MIRKILYRLFMVAGIYFMVAGIVGFLSVAISAEGGFDWLGASVEWPMGVSDGVVQTEDYHFIAINVAAGRIQYYDSQWTFKWGLRIEAGGGTFKISSVKDDTFEVVTARGNYRYSIDYKGNVRLTANYPDSIRYGAFGDPGYPAMVPTYFFLYPFSTPEFAFLSIILGCIILVIAAKVIRDRCRPGIHKL
jgi:hypothetical protein